MCNPICMYVCMYVCMYSCMHVCMYACIPSICQSIHVLHQRHSPYTPAPRHKGTLKGLRQPHGPAYNMNATLQIKLPGVLGNLPEVQDSAMDSIYESRAESLLAIDEMIGQFLSCKYIILKATLPLVKLVSLKWCRTRQTGVRDTSIGFPVSVVSCSHQYIH